MSEEESKGLGDTVEKIIHSIGDNLKIDFIRNKKGCESCRRRKEMLNKMVPYTAPTEEASQPAASPSTEPDCPECEKKKKGGCRKCGNK